jgi:polar amino acid transport system permease protein
VLWRAHFLSTSLMQPALALIVFGVGILLLTFGAAQSGRHPLNIFAELYIDALRGIPMLVIILYVGFPLQGAIRDATGGLINMSRLTRGVVAIALGYAAYLAEIFRAGIEAIPHGQTEAARSLGLTGWQTARYVVLPQALRIVVPPLGNEFIAMLKDTSLLSVLSVRDITQRAREFQAATFQVFPPYNTVALLYIGLTLAASSFVKWLERKTSWTR